jgi:hypothetical protein
MGKINQIKGRTKFETALAGQDGARESLSSFYAPK